MFGLLILLGIIASFLVPLAAPVICATLVAGGVVAYRQSTDAAMRTLGAAAIAAGAVIVLAGVLVWLGFRPVRFDTSVSGGVPMIIPKP